MLSDAVKRFCRDQLEVSYRYTFVSDNPYANNVKLKPYYFVEEHTHGLVTSVDIETKKAYCSLHFNPSQFKR